jgi:CHAT domain-containing protein/Tfp pilus assembly protein PilF
MRRSHDKTKVLFPTLRRRVSTSQHVSICHVVMLLWLLLIPSSTLCRIVQKAKTSSASLMVAEGEVLRSHWQRQAFEEAIRKYARARDIYRVSGDVRMEARTLTAMAEVLLVLGRYPIATECYTRALSLYRTARDREGEAKSLLGLASVLLQRGQYHEAMRQGNLALEMSEELQNQSIKSDALINVAIAAYYLGNFNEATRLLNKTASNISASDVRNQARIASNLGILQIDQGEPEKAFEFLNRSLRLWRSANNRQEEAATLGYIGTQYAFIGEYQTSLDHVNQALLIFREIGDRKGIADQLMKLGYTYLCLGEFDNAISYYSQAVGLYRELPNHHREGTTLGDIGDVHLMLGNATEALNYYNRSLRLVRIAGDKQWEAFVLEAIGRANSVLENRTQSLRSFTAALSLFRQLGNQRWEATTLVGIAAENILLNNLVEARSSLDLALKLSRDTGDLNGESSALYQLSRLETKYRNFEKAKTQIELVIRISETLRSKLLSQQSRSSYLASIHKYYEGYVDLLMRMHEQSPAAGFDSMALEASERGRARSLIEMMIESGSDIRRGVDAQLLANEKALEQQLNELTQQELRFVDEAGGNVSSNENLNKQIQKLTIELQQIQARIRAASPRYAAMVQPRPVATAEVQQMLEPDTALLEFSLGSDRSYVWVVGQTFIKGFALPPRAELETLARRVYESVAVAESNAVIAPKKITADNNAIQVAGALSKVVLGPVEDFLSQKKRVVIVADGFLQHIPFAMLPISKSSDDLEAKRESRRLIDDYEVTFLPAASVLSLQRQQFSSRGTVPRGLAVFADPVFDSSDSRTLKNKKPPGVRSGRVKPGPSSSNDRVSVSSAVTRALRSVGLNRPGSSIPRLPFSRDEAMAIAASASGDESVQALDFKASLQTLNGMDLSKYRYVHFATHGLVNSQHPELSGIVLSLVNERGERVDGFLPLQEIYNLKLSADLVVLSACQTALGKDVNGEGLIGLTRGFMYAGAKSVVGSLWKVDDSATAALMSEFYKEMLINGERPAAALRSAQISISNQKRWRSPYYWAGFVLQGEWR